MIRKSSKKKYKTKSRKVKSNKKKKSKLRNLKRNMRGGGNILDLNGNNLSTLNSNYSQAKKYPLIKINNFTQEIKNNSSRYNGNKIVDLIYNTVLPSSLSNPFKQYDHGLVSNGIPEMPITAGLPGTHVYVLVDASTKQIINILGIVTNP